MPGIPFLEHGALVHGRAAVGVAWLLQRSIDRGGLDGLPEGVYEETVAAIQAVDLAAMAWTRRTAWSRRTAAELGRTAARHPADPSPSIHARTITVDEAARMLKLSVRRTRDLAASGLGRKAGGTWLLDPAAVEAEARRRGAA